MYLLSDYPDTPDAYTHPLWKKRYGKPWASQEELPVIILEGSTVRERFTAISFLTDPKVRLITACKVQGFDEKVWLMYGIHDQKILYDFLMDGRNNKMVRTLAVDLISDRILLQKLLSKGPEDTQSLISNRLMSNAHFYDNKKRKQIFKRSISWIIKTFLH